MEVKKALLTAEHLAGWKDALLAAQRVAQRVVTMVLPGF